MDELKVAKLRTLMGEHDLDAVVGFSKENVAYLTSYVVQSQALDLSHRHFAVVLTRDGATAFMVTIGELSEAERRSAIRDLRPYDDFSVAPMKVLADVLIDLGLAAGRVGLDLEGLSAVCWDDLKLRLPGTAFSGVSDLFKAARMTKTPAEIASLRAASSISEVAQAAAHAAAEPGMTEQDLRRLIVDAALAAQAEAILSVQVAAGERSVLANPVSGDRAFRAGEIVKIDVSVTVDGYCSDTGRAVVVGGPDAHQEEVWAHLQETMRAIHRSIRAGASTVSVWETFVDEFARKDRAPVYRFLGHGLGLGLHEEPFVWSGAGGLLQEGMVLSVEPVYHDGDTGYHLEDTLVVTADGLENFTARFGPELITIPGEA